MILIFCFVLIILCTLLGVYYSKTLKLLGTAEQMLFVEIHDYSLNKTMSLANSVKANDVQVGP